MTRSRLGELPPNVFENDPPVLDPAEIDSHYSPQYLARRGQLLERIQRIRHNVEKYDPDQPRDDHGRWSRGGSSGSGSSRKAPKLSRKGAAWFTKKKLLSASAKAAASVGTGTVITAGVSFMAEHLLHLCHSYAAIGGGLAFSALVHSLVQNAAAVFGISEEKAKKYLDGFIDNLIGARKAMINKADDGDEVLDFLYGLKDAVNRYPEEDTSKSESGASNLQGQLHKPSRFVETGEGLIIEPAPNSEEESAAQQKPLPRYRPRFLRNQE